MTTIGTAADFQLIFQALVWGLGIVGGAFVACIVWFLIRVLQQFDKVVIGLSELKELVKDDMHLLDIRITKLESWREAMIQASQTQRILEMAKHVSERIEPS